MKNSDAIVRQTKGRWLGLVLLLFAFVCGTAFPSVARPSLSYSSAILGISVINNSNREIRHLYLSPVDQNAWGSDLLDGRVIKKGETFTITEAVCQGNEIKVVAEDQQGCFVYGVVSCAQATTSWTINDDTLADCG